MRIQVICCCILLLFPMSSKFSAVSDLIARTRAAQDYETVEKKVKVADQLWLKNSADKAVLLYEELLADFPDTCKPFLPTIIMRLGYAYSHLGNYDDCLEILQKLDGLEYVPEHHRLAAQELKVTISHKANPGLKKTQVPLPDKINSTIYVNATAGPNGSGTKDDPTLTLNQAVNLARECRKAVERGVIEIVLAPGVYEHRETVQLNMEDDGLVIRSQDPANPAVLSGGIRLNNWKKVEDEQALSLLPESVRNKVLTCDLKDTGIDLDEGLVFGGFSSARAIGRHARFRTFPVPELFYKNQPQTMARWPNDSLIVLPINAPPVKADPRYSRWAQESDLWLYGYWYWDWADAYEKVAAIDKSGMISLVPPVNRYGFRRNLGCVLNALSEMDRPGEWYLDTEKMLIYFLPPQNYDPAQCVLSSFGTVLSAQNCPNLQIRDIKIENIRGDALTFMDCSALILDRIDIENCSGQGIVIHGGKNHLVHTCTIASMGRGGIDFRAGDWKNLDPCNSIIENCRISNLSRIDRTYTPALLLEGMGIKVRHNAFVDIPSSAIRVEACDALVELNYFHNCVYESGDQGAIDMWANPLYRGNIIRWNDFDRIINKTRTHYGAAAIRHDDWISGFMVSENIFRKGSEYGFGSIQFNQGTDNYVEGNVIIDWHKAFTGWSASGEDWKKKITSHSNSKRMLEETPWQSEKWRKKYPMVRDLLNGDDNHNYLVDNQSLGSGGWGSVKRAKMFANTWGDTTFHGENLISIKSFFVPWHPIPIDHIGPYKRLHELKLQ